MTLEKKQAYIDTLEEGWKAIASSAKASCEASIRKLSGVTLFRDPEQDRETKVSVERSYHDEYERFLDKIIELNEKAKKSK